MLLIKTCVKQQDGYFFKIFLEIRKREIYEGVITEKLSLMENSQAYTPDVLKSWWNVEGERKDQRNENSHHHNTNMSHVS